MTREKYIGSNGVSFANTRRKDVLDSEGKELSMKLC
jgi:hypothetical protein